MEKISQGKSRYIGNANGTLNLTSVELIFESFPGTYSNKAFFIPVYIFTAPDGEFASLYALPDEYIAPPSTPVITPPATCSP